MEWTTEILNAMTRNNLTLKTVILATPGLRIGHYSQIHRALKRGTGLSQAKRDALMTTIHQLSARP